MKSGGWRREEESRSVNGKRLGEELITLFYDDED